MKKWTKWLLIVIGVIVIGTIAFFIYKSATREEAVLTFPDTVVVQNVTDLDVERTTKAIAYNVLEYDTIKITIAKMPKHIETVGDIDLLAYINQNPFKEKEYMIFLSSKVTDSNLKKVLSHEFVHLKQMEEKRLIQFPPDEFKAIWDGDTINYKTVSYKQRPHEIDAHRQDGSIYNQLDKVLYK